MLQKQQRFRSMIYSLIACIVMPLLILSGSAATPSQAAPTSPLTATFQQAASETGVPVELLQAICYLEGRLSNHDGKPSIDKGYGCMHLMQNERANTLKQAAQLLKVDERALRVDMATNIRGGAAVLREYALQLSATRTLPATLDDWAGALARYSHATTQTTMQMYLDGVYKLLNSGFQAHTEQNEEVILQPHPDVRPRLSSMRTMSPLHNLPAGCRKDGKAEYSGAINCILDPAKFDCNRVKSDQLCNYESTNRPKDFRVSHIVVHDIEGTAISALHVFQNPKYESSAHYIIDTDGTIYQMLRERDMGYHAGNYWYNQHSIGLEHAGYDEKGYLWYNAAQYLASAKLTAYLLKKYDVPFDHDHIISHGAIPSPTLGTGPNHVDPGPYWLWPYYLQLISEQGARYTGRVTQQGVVTVIPSTGFEPYGPDGTETKENFNFFYLYTKPNTASARIPAVSEGVRITNVADNIEAETSYAYTARQVDQAGTGMIMYKIWYGVQDPESKPWRFVHARQVWLAVQARDVVTDRLLRPQTLISLNGSDKKTIPVSGQPTSGKNYHIGDAPTGARFISTDIIKEDGKETRWYEINYNHRQGWVPADAVTVIRQA